MRLRSARLVLLILGAFLSTSCASVPTPLASEQHSATLLGTFKNDFEALQAFISSIALIVAAIWTYMLFVSKRQRYARASISHQLVECKPVSNDRLYVRVHVSIKNASGVLLIIDYGYIYILQMIPWPSELLESLSKGEEPVPEDRTDVRWPPIGNKLYPKEQGDSIEIEPGDRDEIAYGFFIPAATESIIVYTYFRNRQKRGVEIGWKKLRRREIGWNNSSVHDLRTFESAKSASGVRRTLQEGDEDASSADQRPE